MQFQRVAVEGLAFLDAPDVVTSLEIEQRINAGGQGVHLREGTIELLTGVAQRRVWRAKPLISTLAAQAGKKVLDQTRTSAGAIDLLISTSVSKDYLEPSVASGVHAELGCAPRCLNFDVANACLAFLDGMHIAATMIEQGSIDRALIVDAENSHTALESTIEFLQQVGAKPQDLSDHFATLTLGSGAAAMLLCREDLATTSHRFRGGVRRAASQWNHLCKGSIDRMVTDAASLLKAGVELAAETFEAAQAQLGWSAQSLDALIMHQVGAKHMSTIRKTLGLEGVPAHVTYTHLGNMGPAAIPVTLRKAIDEGAVFEGDRVALMGIGSGINCAMMTWDH